MRNHYQITVSGKVQGVFFRKYTKEEADRNGIKGIVRNEKDGSVYIEAEGEEFEIRNFIEWCWMGSPKSQVKEVKIEQGRLKHYKHFEIIYR